MQIATELQVGSLTVRLESLETRGSAAIRSVADSFGVALTRSAEPNAVIRVATSDSLPAPDELAQRLTSYGPDVHIFRTIDGYSINGPSASSSVHIANSRATVTGLENDWSDAEVQGHVVVVLTLLLRGRGFFPLHAAGVSRGSEGILVVGPSDVGKSTLAYNLVRNGWSFISDDTVLLHASDATDVSAHTFRKSFGLDAEIANRRPEVESQARPMTGDGEKWSVSVSSLFPGSHALACTPTLLVFPAITNEPKSRLEPISSGEAFMRMVSQSALREFSDPQTARHHSALGALLAQSRRARLLAGLDLHDNPSLANDLVLSALRPS